MMNTWFPANEAAVSARLTRAAAVGGVASLALVWLQVHSWEAYMYASSHEGFISLRDMFSATSSTNDLADVSRFHPYHPLFHMLVTAAWRAAIALCAPVGVSVSALTVAALINKLSAVVVVMAGWRILKNVVDDRLCVLVALVGMATTKAFLFGAFSGDAHILSLACFLSALAVVLRPAGEPGDDLRATAGAAVLFALGASFNLAIFFYGLVPIAVVLEARRFRSAGLALVVSAILLTGVYVVLPVVLLELSSLAAYESLFTIYSYLTHAEAPLVTRVVAFADALGSGLVGGLGPASLAARVFLGTAIAGGLLALVFESRKPRSAEATPRFWIPFWFFGFAVGELAMHTEESVNGTIYVAFPTFALVAFFLCALPRSIRFVAMVGVLVVGILNIEKVIITKRFPDSEGAPRLASMIDEPNARTPVTALLSHMSLFQEIYHLGHDRGLRDIRIVLPDTPKGKTTLQHFVDEEKEFCLLSATPLPSGLRSLMQTRIELSPDLYHFSVNHPDSKRMIKKSVYFSCRADFSKKN